MVIALPKQGAKLPRHPFPSGGLTPQQMVDAAIQRSIVFRETLLLEHRPEVGTELRMWHDPSRVEIFPDYVRHHGTFHGKAWTVDHQSEPRTIRWLVDVATGEAPETFRTEAEAEISARGRSAVGQKKVMLVAYDMDDNEPVGPWREVKASAAEKAAWKASEKAAKQLAAELRKKLR